MSANAWLAELNAARQARQPAVRHTHTLHNGRELVIIQKHGAHLGSSLWHAALPLAHYLHASGLWRRRSGRRVLELGAGCGAAGLAAAISADSAEMPELLVLTEKPELVPHLRANAEANAAALDDRAVRVLPLDWVAASAEDWDRVLAGGQFDLVLAADCVYELPLLKALADAAARALAPDGVFVCGFCRRGGALCPPSAVEPVLLERFDIAERASLALDGPATPAAGSDTSAMTVLQLTLRR